MGISRQKKRVTLKDIAAVAGVSATAVSVALNREDILSQEVRQKVRAIAEEMGYVPNEAARALRGVKTRSIGVVINYFSNASFTAMISGIEETLNDAGITFWVSQTHDTLEREKMQVRLLAERGVDGIILVPCSDASEHVETIASRFDIPIVLMTHTMGNKFAAVQADNWHGATEVTRHLLQTGADRPILLLSGTQQKSGHRIRKEAFCAALTAARPTIDPEEFIFYVPALRAAEGYKVMDEVFGKFAPPISIFAGTDDVALGVLEYCRRNNLRMPEDVALAGFSGIGTLEELNIPLTTVKMPWHTMGKIAARTLLDLSEYPEKRKTPPIITMPVTLIARESTAVTSTGNALS